MAYYAIGSELNAVGAIDTTAGSSTPLDTTEGATATSRGSIDLVYGALGIWIDIMFQDAETGLWLTAANGLKTFWSAFSTYAATLPPGNALAQWCDATGVPWLQLCVPTGGSNDELAMQYWNGAAWITLTNTFLMSERTVIRYDVSIDAVGGNVEVFYNNNLVASGSADLSGLPSLVKMRLTSSGYGGYPSYVGLWLVSDTTTREHTIMFEGATGNGSEQQWTGDYTDIDEFPETSADIIYTSTAGEASTFTHGAFPALGAGQVVKAVAVGMYMRRDTSGPQNSKIRLNVAGTAYDLPVQQPDIDYLGRVAIWNNDPSTGAPWNGLANVDGEFGIVSEA